MLIKFIIETCAGLHTCPACLVQTVHMVSNLPHITVRLPGTEVGIGKREALLMVDLGASGIDIIFHSKAVKELGLQDLPKAGAIQLKVCSLHCRGIAAQPAGSHILMVKLQGKTCSISALGGGLPALPWIGQHGSRTAASVG